MSSRINNTLTIKTDKEMKFCNLTHKWASILENVHSLKIESNDIKEMEFESLFHHKYGKSPVLQTIENCNCDILEQVYLKPDQFSTKEINLKNLKKLKEESIIQPKITMNTLTIENIPELSNLYTLLALSTIHKIELKNLPKIKELKNSFKHLAEIKEIDLRELFNLETLDNTLHHSQNLQTIKLPNNIKEIKFLDLYEFVHHINHSIFKTNHPDIKFYITRNSTTYNTITNLHMSDCLKFYDEEEVDKLNDDDQQHTSTQ